MRTTVVLLSIISLFLLSACQKSEVVKSVEGTYTVSGWQKNNGIVSNTVYNTLKVTGIKSGIKVQYGTLTRKYVLVSDNADSYSFAKSAGMECISGEDIITIGKNSNSISAQFWGGYYGYAAGIKVGH